MQPFLITHQTWYFLAKAPGEGVPSKIAITPPFRVGRREGFDLCLNCKDVSGLHAELLEDRSRLMVEDLGSTNGTFVNDARISERTSLGAGDKVRFGQHEFSVACIGCDSAVPESVIENSAPAAVPETTEERFERLLQEGVVPFFQPIFNITGEANERVGYEVLGRSRLFGLKTPDQMFAAATDLEKESELSRILRLRGIEAAESAFPNDVMLFVNTHPAELDCIEIQKSLKTIRDQFPQRTIMLELPELVLYTSGAHDEMFKIVRELDVQLVLHDFGAGQIRLAELSKMDPSVVKFDCALTEGIAKSNAKKQRLISSMVKMVTELGMTPMAEYVETASDHEAIKQIGFELGQGFHYGHPGSIENLTIGSLTAESHSKSDVIDRRLEPRPLDIAKQLDD